MFARGKKPVTLEYKEKLLADIAYYEKRIEDALHKTVHNSSYDVESSDEESNPYTVNSGPFPVELKREEARLSTCVSMSLELAKLTILQSEVNVLATAPEVRKPVVGDGTWYEVAAECKIDLVPFTIIFCVHKPHDKAASRSYRNLRVELTKRAHSSELALSLLPRLQRPSLAQQLLLSYAAAFRSRRTTLLELAERYADKLNMEAMAEGGYRVRFLDLLTVEWSLENVWSPVAPFCHRMKFEVEYMPKHYIHAIGKLYKQFKDPSLETSERTGVLSKIFGICLEAQGPARELQDTLESDPETAGRLHERRTTIDQELEPPNGDQNIQLSPQKLPKDRENKQNKKTNMAPPKSLPKKAKKVTNKNKENNEVVNPNVSKTSNNKTITSDVSKKAGTDKDKHVPEVRKGVKRTIESDDTSNAKKIKSDAKNDGKDDENIAENDDVQSLSKNNVQKKVTSKNKGDGDKDGNKKTDGSKKKTETGKDSGNVNNKQNETFTKTNTKEDATSKTVNVKGKETDAVTSKKAKGKRENSEADTKVPQKRVASGKIDPNNDQTEASVASSKKSKRDEGKSVASNNTSEKDSTGSSKDKKKNENDGDNIPPKNLKNTANTASLNKKTVSRDSGKQSDKSNPVVEKVVDTGKKVKDNIEKENNAKAFKTKVISDKKTKNDRQSAKQSEVKEMTEKKVKSKQNPDKVIKTKESLQEGTTKNKIANIEKKTDKNSKNLENNKLDLKSKESLSSKVTKPNNEITKNINSVGNKKNATVADKIKTIVPKVSKTQAKTDNASKISNHNKAVDKVTASNKITAKNLNNAKDQNKNNDKLKNIIPKKTIPQIFKPNAVKTTAQADKSKENQTKAPEKLTTRIPMMQNKLKLGAFNNKLGKVDGKLGKNAEKTKIPLKSLPVFKKIVRNPTRMSPRKLPSTIKPSSHGFSIK